jgi:hypothetical protein
MTDYSKISMDEAGGIAFLIPDHPKRFLHDDLEGKVEFWEPKLGSRLLDHFDPYPAYPYPFDPQRFHATHSIGFDWQDESKTCNSDVDTWLKSLPIEGQEKVFVFRQNKLRASSGCPVMSFEWRHFTARLWAVIWPGLSYFTVLTKDGGRFLLFGPETFIVYGTEGPVRSPPPSPEYGFHLLRVRQPHEKGKVLLWSA